jgi:hypothetical protein
MPVRGVSRDCRGGGFSGIREHLCSTWNTAMRAVEVTAEGFEEGVGDEEEDGGEGEAGGDGACLEGGESAGGEEGGGDEAFHGGPVDALGERGVEVAARGDRVHDEGTGIRGGDKEEDDDQDGEGGSWFGEGEEVQVGEEGGAGEEDEGEEGGGEEHVGFAEAADAGVEAEGDRADGDGGDGGDEGELEGGRGAGPAEEVEAGAEAATRMAMSAGIQVRRGLNAGAVMGRTVWLFGGGVNHAGGAPSYALCGSGGAE